MIVAKVIVINYVISGVDCERIKYDWLLQLSNYRCPITTLTANASIIFNENCNGYDEAGTAQREGLGGFRSSTFLQK